MGDGSNVGCNDLLGGNTATLDSHLWSSNASVHLRNIQRRIQVSILDSSARMAKQMEPCVSAEAKPSAGIRSNAPEHYDSLEIRGL